ELCRKIKAHPDRRHVPVLLLTSLSDPLDVLEGIQCGADNFLTRPNRPDALLARLRYIFANRARRSASRLRVCAEGAVLGTTSTTTWGEERIRELVRATCEGAVRDNRELRASQAELRRAHEELDVRVRARTAELADANAALRRQVEDRGRAERRLAIQH